MILTARVGVELVIDTVVEVEKFEILPVVGLIGRMEQSGAETP